jgi:hypothetical protein
MTLPLSPSCHRSRPAASMTARRTYEIVGIKLSGHAVDGTPHNVQEWLEEIVPQLKPKRISRAEGLVVLQVDLENVENVVDVPRAHEHAQESVLQRVDACVYVKFTKCSLPALAGA